MILTCGKTFNCIKLKLNQQHAHCFTVSNEELVEHCTILQGATARSDARLQYCADSRGFDPYVRQHSFVEIGHEIKFSAILSIPLIQEGQLSVIGERMFTTA